MKCGEIKPLSAFYKHPAMADGHVNKCKECNKADNRRNRASKPEQYKQYESKRAQLDHRKEARAEFVKSNPEVIAAIKKRSKERHPKARAANQAVSNALRAGTLVRWPCMVCDEVKVEGHHPDYDQPLQVVWLCKDHHTEIHKEFWQS